jgi:prepilin-type N-terminal cleavage/methylation domain-containing protein
MLNGEAAMRHIQMPLTGHRGRIGRQEGFSLLEVTITLLIIGVAFLLVSGVQITSITSNKAGFKLSVAASLAEQRVQQLKNLPFTDGALTAGTTAEADVTVNNVTYSRTYTVTDNAPLLGLKLIDYSVLWSGGHSMNLVTRVGN